MQHGTQNAATGGSGSKLPGNDEGRKRDNDDHNKNKRPWFFEETKDARKKLKAAKEELAISMEWLADLESGINQIRAENLLLLWEMALLKALVEDFLDDIDPQDD